MKAMIVHNESATRTAIRLSIEAVTWEVHELPTAEDAIRHCSGIHPDSVLIGLHFEGMDGFSAVRILHLLCPRACLILVTEFDDPAIERRARELGCCHCLSNRSLPLLPTRLRQLALRPAGSGCQAR